MGVRELENINSKPLDQSEQLGSGKYYISIAMVTILQWNYCIAGWPPLPPCDTLGGKFFLAGVPTAWHDLHGSKKKDICRSV